MHDNILLLMALTTLGQGKLDLLFRISACFVRDLPPQLSLSISLTSNDMPTFNNHSAMDLSSV